MDIKSIIKKDSSFTLVELLVVIGILAILTASVVVVLNPAQLVAQSRDTTRFSDMETINKALSLYQTDGGSSFGAVNTVYVSIPDTSTSCTNLGLATLPSGWSYACVTSANLRNVNGTGWIPVNFSSVSIGSPLSSLPTDPINATSTNNFYTYVTNGSNWTVSAQSLESSKYATRSGTDGGTSATAYEVGSSLSISPYVYPNNWVKVPGNSTFGTTDFYVMKYEAKCIQASNSTPLTAPDSWSNHTYTNSSQPCVGPSYYIASAPGGNPITSIYQTDAISYCASIGAHLITNNEWKTIAWNVESVSSNWSGGSPGSGHIYEGHDDNAPPNALTADSNDANGYFGETNTGGNQKRALTLSNGSVVWDMAGNVYEWNSDTIIGTNQPHGTATGWNWLEYTAITTWGSMTQQTAGPLNSSWNSGNGIGLINSENGIDNTVYAFLRGGFWRYPGYGGVETLQLVNIPNYMANNFGFRCAR